SRRFQLPPRLRVPRELFGVEPKVDLRVEQVAFILELNRLEIRLAAPHGLTQAVNGLMQIAACALGIGVRPEHIHQNVLGDGGSVMRDQVLEDGLAFQAVPLRDYLTVPVNAEHPQTIGCERSGTEMPASCARRIVNGALSLGFFRSKRRRFAADLAGAVEQI